MGKKQPAGNRKTLWSEPPVALRKGKVRKISFGLKGASARKTVLK